MIYGDTDRCVDMDIFKIDFYHCGIEAVQRILLTTQEVSD